MLNASVSRSFLEYTQMKAHLSIQQVATKMINLYSPYLTLYVFSVLCWTDRERETLTLHGAFVVLLQTTKW